MLHKRSPSEKIDSNEGQRELLCSNKMMDRCPSLDFNSNCTLKTKKELLNQFASIIVELFLEQINNEQPK
jgi:hypothetical protein